MSTTRGSNLKKLILGLPLAGILVAAFVYREDLLGLIKSAQQTEADQSEPPKTIKEAKVLQLSPQAQQNLKLVSRPIKLEPYRKKILIPGKIQDRPGLSDHTVTSPAVGVITKIHSFPGDHVHAGDPLFSLRLTSEYLQKTQEDLFKATRETKLIKEQRERIGKLVATGALPQSRLIELDQQLQRQQAAIDGYRQDLLTRGITLEQLEEISKGTFASTIEVLAPKPVRHSVGAEDTSASTPDSPAGDAEVYELQELGVEMGTQVQSGQMLCVLANHEYLLIAGHAFKREAPFLEKAAQNGWPIAVDFTEDDAEAWPAFSQEFTIHHLANAIDPETRTFDFYITLTNQSRSYTVNGETVEVWRFRPGQQVRLRVPVEEFKDVIVLPVGAVVREGPEAYVFRQNGDLFDRKSVQVLYEDRMDVVLDNDWSIPPGVHVAQSGAASLNRVLKSQSASGTPVGMHVHADGTVHGAE